MRGDSIRDLYAKTLALLGLSVLAGAGALVDYWPSPAVELPAGASVLARPELALARPVPTLELPRLAVASPARALRVVAATAPSTEPEPQALFISVSREFSAGQAIALNEPPLGALTPSSVFASLGEEVFLSDPVDELMPVASIALMAAPVALSADDDERDGFIGASKRLGTSIIRTGIKTGIKTGASVMDALRFVKTAVRKALPV